MSRSVAILGVGATPFRPTTPDVSFREMIYEAAVRAYADARVQYDEIESFVSCTEDLIEGTSIADEYCPDQLGAARKPVHTIAGDGIHGLASAFMLIRSGLFDLVAVEAHSKISNIDRIDALLTYATDPIYQRQLGLNPQAIAAMEMRAFLNDSGNTPKQCATVVCQNRLQALKNQFAAYPGSLTPQEVMESDELTSPLHEGEKADHADGAIVMVLGSAKKISRRLKPVWIHGIGWGGDSYALESREWQTATYAKVAAARAYQMAGMDQPRRSIDLVEIDDSYAYKELQHLESVGLVDKGRSGRLVERIFEKGFNGLVVNPSGGSLGGGHLGEASGLARVMELVIQIRKEAGPRQVDKIRHGLALSWRGIPTSSGACMILGDKRP